VRFECARCAFRGRFFLASGFGVRFSVSSLCRRVSVCEGNDPASQIGRGLSVE